MPKLKAKSRLAINSFAAQLRCFMLTRKSIVYLNYRKIEDLSGSRMWPGSRCRLSVVEGGMTTVSHLFLGSFHDLLSLCLLHGKCRSRGRDISSWLALLGWLCALVLCKIMHLRLVNWISSDSASSLLCGLIDLKYHRFSAIWWSSFWCSFVDHRELFIDQ